MDDSGSDIVVALRFREFAGAFMEHCHNTQHEDHAMLLRWDIENPGQLKPFLTPEPQWNGCTYTESSSLPSARTQEGGADRAPELVGDWKEREDFMQTRDIRAVLCAAGSSEACADSAGAASGSGSGASVADAETTPSATAGPETEAAVSEQEPAPTRKKRVWRKRGGRRGGGRHRSESIQP
jgi:hypothetical protein